MDVQPVLVYADEFRIDSDFNEELIVAAGARSQIGRYGALVKAVVQKVYSVACSSQMAQPLTHEG